jgi:cell wall-associated NlpC family hydrolase
MNARTTTAPRPRAFCLLVLFLAALWLAGCSSGPDVDRLIAPTTDTRTAIAAKALEKLGADYRTGASGPAAFDDSGLAYYAYRGAGATLARETQAQLDGGKPIELAAAQPADLIFFRIEDGQGNDQLVVGLYTRAGEMLMASPGFGGESGVALFNTDDEFWQQRMVGVVRQLP